MTTRMRHPRQNPRAPIKRAPVKKHMEHSVGTNQPNDFYNPGNAKATRMALLSQSGQFK